MSRPLAALVLVAALHAPVLAQPVGRIEGRVFDAATGQPLVGGQVRVLATSLGNVTRGDGSFFIERVPIGLQQVSTGYLGYREVSREARVLSGGTTRVEFALGEAAIETAAIVATIAYEPWIPGVTLPPRPVLRPLPDRLPASRPPDRCHVRAVLHGAFIRDGRWMLQTSVGDLRCSTAGADAGITQRELTHLVPPDTFRHAPGAQGSDLPTPSGPEGSSGT